MSVLSSWFWEFLVSSVVIWGRSGVISECRITVCYKTFCQIRKCVLACRALHVLHFVHHYFRHSGQFWSFGAFFVHFATILSLGPKNGQTRPQMTKNGLNVWKVTSETISIGFLLLLRSFWVVTWLVCNNFEFGAKIGQKWPKKALNDQKKA